MSTNSHQPLKVLFPIHTELDALDFVGPLEVLSHAHFPAADGTSPKVRAFHCTITAVDAFTSSSQGIKFCRDIGTVEAHQLLSEFNVMVIPGGGTPGVLEHNAEPLGLIRAFAALPKREDGQVRVLLSVCTGSLLLGSQGVLGGLTAVTHPDFRAKLLEICSRHEAGGGSTMVMDERYTVNRINDRGMQVVTSGGISCGLDAALWLVENIAGEMAREQVEQHMQYTWKKGLVID